MTRNQYRTGVTYSHEGDAWTDGAPFSVGPEWHATPADTADVAAQLRRLGYTVTEVTR